MDYEDEDEDEDEKRKRDEGNEMEPGSNHETDNRKRLMALMTQHQRRIFAYIYTLVPDRYDAEDLLQETSLVICEKFDQFEEGTDFVAWACQIAYWRIRYARQKFARSKVVFRQDIVDALAQTAAEMHEELDERHEALSHCLQKLPVRDRELVLTRYEPGGGVPEAARRSGRSVETAYKALAPAPPNCCWTASPISSKAKARNES